MRARSFASISKQRTKPEDSLKALEQRGTLSEKAWPGEKRAHARGRDGTSDRGGSTLEYKRSYERLIPFNDGILATGAFQHTLFIT